VFHQLVFDKGHNNFKCFNRATHNYTYEPLQPIPVRYHTSLKTIPVFVGSYKEG